MTTPPEPMATRVREALTRPHTDDQLAELEERTTSTDPPLFHLVHEDRLAPALAAGTPVTALCGYVWVPTRRHRPGDPWCRRCIELGIEFLNTLRQIQE